MYKNEEDKKEYARLYYLKNKSKLKIEHKNYYEDNKFSILEKSKEKYNPEKKSEYNKKYIKEHKSEISNYMKGYYLENKDKLYIKQLIRINNKLSTDPLFKLSLNIRTLIRYSFKSKNTNKNSKTKDILGCSFEEFKVYLESKFEPWMNWENHGKYNSELNYGWDIDHIIPVSSAKSEKEIIELNNYKNLQPLCSKINRNIKRNLLSYEFKF